MLLSRPFVAAFSILLTPLFLHGVVRTDDLLVYYSMDDGAGTNVEDVSANDFHGTMVGMDDADWVEGKFGKALEFGGGDDRLRIPLQMMDSFVDKTISVWIKTGRSHTDAAHFYYGSPSTGGDGFGGQFEYHLNFAANSNRIQYFILSSSARVDTYSPAMNDDQWHLVTVVNKPGEYTLYIDGGQTHKSVDPDFPAPYGFTHYHQLGGPAANRRQFVGLLDDFRIYSISLEESEVQKIYRDGLGDFDPEPTVTLVGEESVRIAQGGTYTEEGAVAEDPVDGTLSYTTEYISPSPTGPTQHTNLLAWWKLDDDALDSSGNDNDGALAGNAAYVDGKFGKALTLDGTGDALDVASFNGVSGSATLSVSAWINLNTLGSDDTGDGAIFADADRNALLWVNYDAATGPLPTSLSFNVGDGGNASNRANGPADVLKVGEWQHVVGVMDGANRKVYVDGVMVGEATTAAQTTVTLDALKAQVGGRDDTSNYWFDGLMDDVRVYSVALTVEEVGTIYNNGDGETIAPVPTTVDTSVLGDWLVVYSTEDQLGQTASAVRNVRVFDTQAPVITLADGPVVTHEAGAAYTAPQVTVKDASGNDLDASQIVTTGTVDPNTPGSYTLQYDFTDDQQRPAETVFQTINVVDTTAPEITISGTAIIKHQLGQPYRDPGASADDFVDGETHPLSSLYTPNQIVRRGYLGGVNEPILILDGNGGMMSHTAAGEVVFTESVGLAGISTFQHPAVGIDNRTSNFRNLFLGYFLAKKDGVYEIGMEYPDDRGVLWLDLDQDKVFESQGNKGNEMISDGYFGGYNTLTLTKGYYRFAAVHQQGGGSASLIFRFKTPEFAGPTKRRTVHPTEAGQDGIWSTANSLDVHTPGSYTITYTATDTNGNTSTQTRTVQVADYPDRPTLALEGLLILTHPASTDYVDPGVTVTDGDGNAVQSPDFQIHGEIPTDVPGEYTLEYNYTDPDTGLSADPIFRTVIVADRFAPEITLTGDAEVEHIYGEPFVEPGVSATDNLDGTVSVGSTANVPRDFWLHVDASQIDAKEGDVLTIWEDLSGNGRHFTDVRGDPTYAATILNGMPAVHLDGDDFMAITARRNNRYSIFTVSQLTGTLNDRLISTKRNVNWLLGYNGNWADVFHPRAWATVANPRRPDTNPNLYTATSSGSIVQFWANTVNKTSESARNGTIDELQIGGYRDVSDPSEGDVSEILLYDHVVTEAERLGTEAYLASKYHLFGFPKHPLPELDRLGEHTILYAARDEAGNFAFATRQVTVIPNPDAPVIQLSTEKEISHEAGTTYVPPVVTVLDKDGNELPLDDLVAAGTVDNATLGEYEITYTFEPDGGIAAIPVVLTVTVQDTTPPEVTLQGDTTVVLNIGDTFADAGSSAVDTFSGAADVTILHPRPGTSYLPGLVVGKLPGELNLAANPGNEPIDPLGPSHSETTAKPPWADSTTFVYTGQVFDEDGVISFTENVDDNALLYVDGQEVLNDDAWDNRTSKALDLGAGGWFDFELRLGNAAGGAGIANGDAPGFGFDPAGGTAYVVPQNTDQDTMDLFRYPIPDYTVFDTSEAGTYDITYTAVDAAGNVGTAIRQVVVLPDASAPYIVLNGASEITIEAGTLEIWEDSGAVAKASDGSVLEDNLTGVGNVDPKKVGTYTITFEYQDTNGNWAENVHRTVIVQDTMPPEITLNGDTFVSLLVNAPYTDAGATATDVADGEIGAFGDLVAIPGRFKVDIHQRNWAWWFFNFEYERNLLLETPFATGFFVNGFLEAGIDLPDDAFVRATFPQLTRSDQFSIVWTGQFHAPRDGEYTFSTSNVDNRGTIWLDKNQNGMFERTEGSLGDERLTWGNQTISIFLSKGAYNTAIGFAEVTGGSRICAQIQTPEGAGPAVLTPIRPGDPEQAHLWSTIPSKGVDTSTPGRYVINYYAEDSAGHLVTAQRIVMVKEDPKQPLIRLLGETDITLEAGESFEEPGILLEDYLGNALEPSLVEVGNLPGLTDTGNFTVTYNYTDPDGHIADELTRIVRISDTTPPVVSLVGVNPLTIPTGQPYVDPGATVSDSFDPDPYILSNIGFPKEGLVLHLDAATLDVLLDNDVPVTIDWEDLSGQGNHADNQSGDPTLKEGVLNGLPVVEFDGDDLIWTTKDFENDLTEYTIISVARYIAGTNARIISSRNRNWLFGYQNKGTGRFYSEGWIQNNGPNNTNWHLHTGTMDSSAIANFWRDNVQLSYNQPGANPILYKPKVIQLGGYNSSSERSDCQVAELLLYDRILTDFERVSLSHHLNGKYNLNGGGTPYITPDTSTSGEFDVTYTGIDDSGNRTLVTRTVLVVDQPQIPVITLTGESSIEYPAGEDYTDAGATVADADGNSIDNPTFITAHNIDITKPGTYSFTYDFTDGQGNAAATAVRTVIVVDQSAPVINLVGGDTIEHQLGIPFIDPGFSALDLVDGEVSVTNSILRENIIRATAFQLSGITDEDLNLDNNGGLLQRIPLQTVDFSRGPLNTGLYLDSDSRFRLTFPALTRNDYYQTLFTGHFYTPTGGIYEFGLERVDDRCSFWLDLDQDEVFESEGDLGSEVMNLGYIVGYRTVELKPGYYRFGITHREGTGGSRIEARYRAIQGYGPTFRTRIRPYEVFQEGSWVQYNPIPHNTPGEYDVVYTAVDAAGNVATVTRTVIVRNNPDAGVIRLNGDTEMSVEVDGTFTDPGFTVLDLNGNDITADGTGTAEGEVDTRRLGEFRISYNFTSGDGVPSRMVERIVHVVDLTPPVITMIGDPEITIFQGQEYEDPGAAAVDAYYGNLAVGSSMHMPADGLVMHLDASSIVGLSDGDAVNLWYDLSNAGNDASSPVGTPVYVASSIGGQPSVHFDGLSSLRTGVWFNNQYSILTVSRLDGLSNQRLLSSYDQNWLLGYDSNQQDAFHPVSGWATFGHPEATTEPNLYTATSTGSNVVRFYANGRDKTEVSRRNGNIGFFQMGAYREMESPASGDVSEVILYNRVLTSSERLSVAARLNAKYSLNGVSSDTVPVDPNTLGTYSVVYQAVDGSGNLAMEVRTIHVVTDPNAPVITLVGDLLVDWEKGVPFVEPGFTLEDSEGNDMGGNLVEVTGAVDHTLPGRYELTYSYVPERGPPAAAVTRIVNISDTQAPVVTLKGDEVVKLTVGDPWTDPGASASDVGDGATTVTNDLAYDLGRILKTGFKLDTTAEAPINLDGNGGLLAEKSVGSSYLTNGPGDRGFDYNSYQDFWLGIVDDQGADVPDQGDKFQILFTAQFMAPVQGEYEFGIVSQDDRTTIWVDLDKDGTFESTGDNGNEQIRNAGQMGWGAVNLDAGHYSVAIAFKEGTGGQNTEVGFSLPDIGNVPFRRLRIKPVESFQNLLWGVPGNGLDTSIPGTHTITYSSMDASGHIGTATRTVVVVADATLPLITLNEGSETIHEAGTVFTDPGATVTDANDNVLETDLKSEDAVDVNTLGQQTITYNFTDANDKVAETVSRIITVVDTTPPGITLKTHDATGGTDTVTLTVGQTWEDPGIDIMDADQNSWFVSSRDYIPNQLDMYGFLHDALADPVLNFDNNGGLLQETPVGQNLFKDGPAGKGYNFASDADWRRMPIGITRDDNYASYVIGYFYAKVDGVYNFRVDNVRDRMGTWLDLDQDGVFESNGNSGNERLTWQNNNRDVTLVGGQFYKVIIGHFEWTGGSTARFRFTTPGNTNPDGETFLKPSDPLQNGLWLSQGEGPIDTNFPGTHTITYYAMDNAGNIHSKTRTVVIEIDQNAPVLTLVGEEEVAVELGGVFTDEGVTATTQAGDPIENPDIIKKITLDGATATNVDGNVAGTYVITYSFTDDQSRQAVPVTRMVLVADTTPPVITINGKATITVPPGNEYNDPGATATDSLDGDIQVTITSSKPDGRYVPGLLAGNMGGNYSNNPNPGNDGVNPLGPSMAYTNQKPPWQNNRTFVYTGEIYDADGILSFREDIQDKVLLHVGHIANVLIDTQATTESSNSIDLGKGGWYAFDLRMSNYNGGAGENSAPGFGYDPEGGDNYIPAQNSDANTMDLFRYLTHPSDTVDTSLEGEYTITFTATDAAGNVATKTRTIIVKDDLTQPLITLEGEADITLEAGTEFIDPGYSVADRRGNTFDAGEVVHDGDLVDTSVLQTYTITYDYSKDDMDAPTVRRKVTVVDTTGPTITLNEGEKLRLDIGSIFDDPGATVSDNLDTSLTYTSELKLEGIQPVAHWEFDQTDGTVATELMNSLNGTLHNFPDPTTAWVDGKYGNALKFEATNASYVSIDPTGILDLQAFTISVWVNTADYDQDMFIFEKTADDNINSQYNLYFENGGTLNFKTIDINASVNHLTFNDTLSLDVDQWQHLAVTYDGTNKFIYLNGALSATDTQVEDLETNPTGPSYIGSYANGANGGYFFNGMMDDLKIYDQSFEESLINSLSARSGIDTSKSRKNPYEITYSSTDSSGNTSTVTRQIVVSNDTTAPSIVLSGDNPMELSVGDTYVEESAIATDDEDGNVATRLAITGTVDTSKAGTYSITYTVDDLSFNQAVATRTVVVTEPSGTHLDQWIADKLPGFSADYQKYDADPDKDSLENLLEYALGGDPSKVDSQASLPTVEESSGKLSVTFFRLKSSVTTGITYTVEFTTSLSTPWEPAQVDIALHADQSDVPNANYEKVTATLQTAMADEPAGRQFIRISVSD